MSDRDILSQQVQPTHYTLDLRNLDFAKWTYDGTVAIVLQIREPISEITLNSNQLELKNAKILLDGALHAESSSFTHDKDTQSTKITFSGDIPASQNATLTIQFQGTINDDMAGFYRSTYKATVEQAASVVRDAGGSSYVMTTQFQPADARRAFPCFDAPNLKATFDVSIEVPTDQVALSNMPVKSKTPTKEGWHVVAFETSPKMSTYLVAWAVGDFAHVEAFTEREHSQGKIPVRIYAVRGTENQGHFAADLAPKVVDLFSDLFDLPYPLKKMDLLAVPGMSLGGMENWGLITAQPAALLFNESTANEGFKQGAASMICHEISHMWFGNLVTMEWWDEIWLNEGFATWLGEYAVDRFFPEWSVWTQFVSDRMEFALRLDGLRSTHPVHLPVASGILAHQALDGISYGKGCAVIRMLINYVGIETFMKGVSNYLKANAYANANALSLWKHLEEASGKEVAAMAKSWISSAGYPVVTVKEDAGSNQISVSQSRFLVSGDVTAEDGDTLWRIPLGIEGLEGGQDAFLSTKEASISGVDPDFYQINTDGNGFYRVDYPQSRLAKLSTQLDKLSPQDRVSIIASTAALANAGASSVTSLLTFLEGFRHETDTFVWQHIMEILASVYGIFADDTETRQGLNRFQLQLFGDKAKEIGLDVTENDTFASRTLRRSLNVNAIRSGHQEIIDSYMPLYKKWEQKGEIDPSIISAVLCAAMQKDPARTHDTLTEALFKSTQSDERVILLVSLARTEDEEAMRKIIAINFATEPSDRVVPPFEMGSVLSVLAGNPVGRQIQWQYMKDNWDKVLVKAGNPILMDHCMRMSLAEFATEEALADIEAFFKDKDTEGYIQTLQNSKEEIRSRAAYKKRDAGLLKQWLVENKYIQ